MKKLILTFVALLIVFSLSVSASAVSLSCGTTVSGSSCPTGTTCSLPVSSQKLYQLFAAALEQCRKQLDLTRCTSCSGTQQTTTTVPAQQTVTEPVSDGSAAETNTSIGETETTSAPAASQETASAPDESEETAPVSDSQSETASTQDSEMAASSGNVDNLSYEQQVVSLVNEQRAANGLAPLTLSTELSNVARAKSQDMHDNQYFSHTSPTYGSPFDMLKSFGISYRAAGENIAMGYQTPEAVVTGWMNSPGHRANILNSSFTQIGVGYVEDGHYWTQLFIG